MQLELSFWPADSVRGILDEYLRMRLENITSATADDDYAGRIKWLCSVMGEGTPAHEVTFVRLEKIARSARGILRDTTIRRRLAFWRWALKYAAMRSVVTKDSIPEMPPWLRDDAIKFEDYYTPEQFREFRLALPPGRWRRLAHLSMWTGMHTLDLRQSARCHFEPDYQWPTGLLGRWLRRNHKNGARPCWIPMEPELREASLEWLAEPGAPDKLIVGPTNNVHREFHAAAARAGLPLIRSNLGFRASHATLLMARQWSYEYTRIVLGHVSEMGAGGMDSHVQARATRPTTLSSHYLRDAPGEHLPVK